MESLTHGPPACTPRGAHYHGCQLLPLEIILGDVSDDGDQENETTINLLNMWFNVNYFDIYTDEMITST